MKVENDILKNAVETFNRNHNTHAFNLSIDLKEHSGQFTCGRRTFDVIFLVKTYMNRARVGLALNELQRLSSETGKPAILVTRYINAIIAEELKNSRYMFLDCVGNACLAFENIFIFIKGNRDTVERKEISPKPLNVSDVKMIFSLMDDPALLQNSYREIALRSKIALGKVGEVLRNLQVKGYLVKLNNLEGKLINRKKLLDEWCVAYMERLRGKLKVGKYTSENNLWWKNADLENEPVCWGGEVAGAEITGILQPQAITVYAWGNIGQFVLKNKLRRNLLGDIEILEAFWVIDGNPKLAPDIVVFADLMTSGNSRNIETAEILYDKRLKNRFE